MHEIVSEAAAPADFSNVRVVEGTDEILRDYADYLGDESKLAHRGAEYLFFPKDEGELAAVFREMDRLGIRVTLSAARTGLVGGAVPWGGAVVSLEKMNRFLDLSYREDAREWRVRAECSVTLRELGEWVRKKRFPAPAEGSLTTEASLERFREDPHEYFYPPDPTETSASLGGTVATNASGARTYKYGATRNWVRRIRVVLACGEVLDIPRGRYFASPEGTFVWRDAEGTAREIRLPTYSMPRTKNTAGFYSAPRMDLIDLFIGSEGLFGAITQVEVALARRGHTISVIQFLGSDAQALDLVEALRREPSLDPEFIEFYDSRSLAFLRQQQQRQPNLADMPPLPEKAGAAVFFDLEFDPAAPPGSLDPLRALVQRCGSSFSDSWAGYETRDRERFKAFRHVLPEAVNSVIAERKKKIPELHKLGTDLAVPDEALREMWTYYETRLDSAGLHWVAFGHIGNNHVHINIIPRTLEEMNTGLSLYRDFARKAVALGGTVSAEHGIGKIKKEFLKLMYAPEALEEMKALKQAWDPRLLLNPGDILDM